MTFYRGQLFLSPGKLDETRMLQLPRATRCRHPDIVTQALTLTIAGYTLCKGDEQERGETERDTDKERDMRMEALFRVYSFSEGKVLPPLATWEADYSYFRFVQCPFKRSPKRRGSNDKYSQLQSIYGSDHREIENRLYGYLSIDVTLRNTDFTVCAIATFRGENNPAGLDILCGCTFPEEWYGRWFQSGNTDLVTVNGSEITSKGICIEKNGDKFLVHDVFGVSQFENKSQQFYLIVINYRDFVETELIEKRSELCLNNSVKEKTDISNDRIDLSDALFIK
ncbi:hypothetical protein EAG_12414 [Camponotus floridanus]|uniref:DUF7044 domain-containing protein n=1 Tax=Camponotus floridanus TaxID=104421 RepID=E2AWF1_CAMFO|nr:hypothetical protein EAG_12414 [Camponotus floridanus]